MNECIDGFGNLKKLFPPRLRPCNERLFDALFNPDPFYDMLRGDMDECCELAIRYGLAVDVERGILKGGRRIYEDSFRNELRVARLFEKYFGKGCLNWDPPGAGGSVGEFLLNIKDIHEQYTIFIEVKTREVQRLTELGTLDYSESCIVSSLSKAYKKAKEDLTIPYMVVLCHDPFHVDIDELQVVKACFGRLPHGKEPEAIPPGYFFAHRRLSAVGVYCFYFRPEERKLQEAFVVFHNPYAEPRLQIGKHIFQDKADRQFILAEWEGKFADV